MQLKKTIRAYKLVYFQDIFFYFFSLFSSSSLCRLNGCYEALEGGNTAEALVDFTGGVSEPISLARCSLMQHPDQRKTLFQTLSKAHSQRALITCSIRVR